MSQGGKKKAEKKEKTVKVIKYESETKPGEKKGIIVINNWILITK